MTKLSVALLGASSLIHTKRWANGLAECGLQIHLISMDGEYQGMDPRVVFHSLPVTGSLGYVGNIFALRRLLRVIKPDLVNVHYASGYGLLARLTGFHPTLLSVWGSDVFSFPDKSLLHRKLLTDNLLFADEIAATSEVMGRRVEELVGHQKKINITPFGIDCEKFKPSLAERNNAEIVIGTVKTLRTTYGIDLLIRSVALLKQRLSLSAPNLVTSLRLKIVGEGPDLLALIALSSSLGIADITEFVGAVSHEDVPYWLNKFDVYVALSRAESFGVAVLEASACGLPVVVSDVGGLPEVVVNERTGYVVPSEDIDEAAKTLERLVVKEDLRKRMGLYGRTWVMERYSWKNSLDIMLNAYQSTICNRGRA
jgi:glycosyltransferase involved in cell wall biosynthesis